VKLAGVREAAEIFHVSRQRVSQLDAEGKLPDPIDRIAAGPVWKASDLELMAKKRGRSEARMSEVRGG
jgi:hypothetical protein